MQAFAAAIPHDTTTLVFQRDPKPKTISSAVPAPFTARPDQVSLAHSPCSDFREGALRMGTEFVTSLSGAVVGLDVGIHAGALLGAAVGTLLAPGIGTAVGGMLGTLGEVVGVVGGGIAGGYLGERAANSIMA
jgi:hypothetical protein